MMSFFFGKSKGSETEFKADMASKKQVAERPVSTASSAAEHQVQEKRVAATRPPPPPPLTSKQQPSKPLEPSKSVQKSIQESKVPPSFPSEKRKEPIESAAPQKKKMKKKMVSSGAIVDQKREFSGPAAPERPSEPQSSTHFAEAEKLGAFSLPFFQNYVPVSEYMKKKQQMLEASTAQLPQPQMKQETFVAPQPVKPVAEARKEYNEEVAILNRQIINLKEKNKLTKQRFSHLEREAERARAAELRARDLLTQYAPLQAENDRLRQMLQEIERRSGQVEPIAPAPPPPSPSTTDRPNIKKDVSTGVSPYRADMDESGAFGTDEPRQQLQRRYSGHGIERFDESGARIYDEPTGVAPAFTSPPQETKSSLDRPDYEKLAADRQYEINQLKSRMSELEYAQSERTRALEEAEKLRERLRELESRAMQPGAAESTSGIDVAAFETLRGKYDRRKATLKETKQELKTMRKSYENLENDNKSLRERISELEARFEPKGEAQDENLRLRERLEELENVRALNKKLQSDVDVAQRRLAELEQSGSSVTQS